MSTESQPQHHIEENGKSIEGVCGDDRPGLSSICEEKKISPNTGTHMMDLRTEVGAGRLCRLEDSEGEM